MSQEMIPCPFKHAVGAEPIVIYHREDSGSGFFSYFKRTTTWYVICPTCDCYGPTMETRADAVAGWNVRAEGVQ